MSCATDIVELFLAPSRIVFGESKRLVCSCACPVRKSSTHTHAARKRLVRCALALRCVVAVTTDPDIHLTRGCPNPPTGGGGQSCPSGDDDDDAVICETFLQFPKRCPWCARKVRVPWKQTLGTEAVAIRFRATSPVKLVSIQSTLFHCVDAVVSFIHIWSEQLF